MKYPSLGLLKKGWFIALSLVTFIALVVGLRVDVGSLLDKKQNATSGKITSQKNTNTRNLLVGSTLFVVNNNNGNVIYDNETPLLSINTKDNKLLVSTTIRNKEGHLIAELKDNEWSHQVRPIIYDRNYNDNALEIRDSTGKVVLQVLNFGDAIQFAANLRCRSGQSVSILPNENGVASMGSLPANEELKHEIKPICSYSSELNLGVCPGFANLEKLSRINLQQQPHTLTGEGGFVFCKPESSDNNSNHN